MILTSIPNRGHVADEERALWACYLAGQLCCSGVYNKAPSQWSLPPATSATANTNIYIHYFLFLFVTNCDVTNCPWNVAAENNKHLLCDKISKCLALGHSWCSCDGRHCIPRKAWQGPEDPLLSRLIHMVAAGSLVSLPHGVLQTTAHSRFSNISRSVRSKRERWESQSLSRPRLQSHTPSLLTDSIHLKWATKSSLHARKRKLGLTSRREEYQRTHERI